MSILLEIVIELFSFGTLQVVVIGSVLGVFFGMIPGLNGAICIAILLPITYGMPPASSLLLLGSIYMGSSFGGAISGILINVPGSSEAACTAIEGYKMATKGRAKEALYTATISSVLGGLVGTIILIFFTPVLAKFALSFGPPEMFLIAILGLTVVGSLSGKSILKGFFAVSFGLFLSLIGLDSVSGTSRFTFGISTLNSGIGIIPAIVGFFAIAEMIKQSQEKYTETGKSTIVYEDISAWMVLKNIFKNKKLLFKSIFLGCWIGILPGTGGAIASFVGYASAKNSYKDGEVLFGEGNVKGIIAAESANNAAVGGSLVPLLGLGIPGSATAAIIYGAILIHGILPGPRLFIQSPVLVYTFMIGMVFAVIGMGVIGIAGVPLFSKILKVKVQYIIPVVLASSFIGAYSVRNSIFDVIVAIACGLIGYFFIKGEIPIPPVLLGLILGNLVEVNLRHSFLIAASKETNILQYMFLRPISAIILIILILTIYTNFKSFKKKCDN